MKLKEHREGEGMVRTREGETSAMNKERKQKPIQCTLALISAACGGRDCHPRAKEASTVCSPF